jgi:hypothetical protein
VTKIRPIAHKSLAIATSIASKTIFTKNIANNLFRACRGDRSISDMDFTRVIT